MRGATMLRLFRQHVRPMFALYPGNGSTLLLLVWIGSKRDRCAPIRLPNLGSNLKSHLGAGAWAW